MASERSSVEGALWRKKVDSSFFEYKVTTIPTWICKPWKIDTNFHDCSSFDDPRSSVSISFRDKIYPGWVTVARNGRSSPAYRLWFEEDLLASLKVVYSMSYMRHLETKLRAAKSRTDDSRSTQRKVDVEQEIPFWEFIDIEHSSKERKFKFFSTFTQKPLFPLLFRNLQGQPSIRTLEDLLKKNSKARIHKTKWLKRTELEHQIGAKNVIYYLRDSVKKLIYVGEAKDLVKRLKQPYPSILNWDFFRYDALPPELESYRVIIERMIIFSYSMVTTNNKHSEIMPLCENHVLKNDRIDLG